MLSLVLEHRLYLVDLLCSRKIRHLFGKFSKQFTVRAIWSILTLCLFQSITWSRSASAGGYHVWTRNINEAGSKLHLIGNVTEGTCNEQYVLFPGVWNFAFAISAFNGNDETVTGPEMVAPSTDVQAGTGTGPKCPAKEPWCPGGAPSIPPGDWPQVTNGQCKGINCVDNQCVGTACISLGCGGPGCIGGVCTTPDCTEKACTGTNCINGACSGPGCKTNGCAGPDCGANGMCTDYNCVSLGCSGQDCDADTGICSSIDCGKTACGGRSCQNGVC